ncbi:MAG: methyltransferase domain-containing protein [Promethearchaeati archaeon SRVP18_Atabeyarchaeia-1]
MQHRRGAFYHDEEARRKWQDPEAILTDIGVRPGSTFVDVGCGEGFFAIPAAKTVGRKGKVYGIDVYNEAVEHLKQKADREGLGNLYLHVGAAEETVICKGCADIVFFGIDLHDFRDPERVLANARVMLKPTGRLVDLDWKKELTGVGPPIEIRFSEEEAQSLIKKAGFTVERVESVGSFHYIIEARLR